MELMFCDVEKSQSFEGIHRFPMSSSSSFREALPSWSVKKLQIMLVPFPTHPQSRPKHMLVSNLGPIKSKAFTAPCNAGWSLLTALCQSPPPSNSLSSDIGSQNPLPNKKSEITQNKKSWDSHNIPWKSTILSGKIQSSPEMSPGAPLARSAALRLRLG